MIPDKLLLDGASSFLGQSNELDADANFWLTMSHFAAGLDLRSGEK